MISKIDIMGRPEQTASNSPENRGDCRPHWMGSWVPSSVGPVRRKGTLPWTWGWVQKEMGGKWIPIPTYKGDRTVIKRDTQ